MNLDDITSHLMNLDAFKVGHCDELDNNLFLLYAIHMKALSLVDENGTCLL
jgi:hypothetical protein